MQEKEVFSRIMSQIIDQVQKLALSLIEDKCLLSIMLVVQQMVVTLEILKCKNILNFDKRYLMNDSDFKFILSPS